MTEATEFTGFLDCGDLDSAVEPEIIPAGDYVATIVSAEQVLSNKAGKPMLKVVFRIDGTQLDNPNLVYHYFNLPAEGDDAQTINNKRLALRYFYKSIGYDYSQGVNVAELPGLQAQVVLTISPATEEYQESNRIKRFQEGR